ncbi:helix-turn-helix transcriptional regulator [Castellaniella sp.]|uniref:helix-turn-helix transcriptional regulator n=1 Tax=Castellaniella sp. TaxID=1955812 RepID=UPI00355F3092
MTNSQSIRPPGFGYAADTLVRVPEICRDPKTGRPGILPISRSTWYEWVKLGIVPPGTRIGGRTVVWRLSDIQALAKNHSGL